MIVKTKEIDKIIFKFPELMNKDSEEIIKRMLLDIDSKKEELHQARNKVYNLEREVQEKEATIKGMYALFEVSYKTKEVADKVHGECNLLITNPTDARNLNYGNP